MTSSPLNLWKAAHAAPSLSTSWEWIRPTKVAALYGSFPDGMSADAPVRRSPMAVWIPRDVGVAVATAAGPETEG
jgi:hypothetical protein